MNTYKRHRFPPEFSSYEVWIRSLVDIYKMGALCIARRLSPTAPLETQTLAKDVRG